MSKFRIRLDQEKIRWFQRNVGRINTKSPPREIKDCLLQWAVRYFSETKRNFKSASRGGGGWKPLAPSTLRQKKNKTSILIATGTLLGALGLRAPGSVATFVKGGIRVGFDGKKRHPSGRASIRDIAEFHQAGKGVPRRKILNRPSDKLVKDMQKDLAKAIDKLGNSR
jgi:hypothetical protein